MNQLRSTFSVQAFEATVYVALSASWAVAFIVLVPTLALAVPLLVVALAGLPLIVFAFALCHLLARVERRRITAVFGTEFPTRHLPRDGRLPSRAMRWVGRRGAWMELCYAVVALPFVGWIGSFLVFFAWGAALAFLSFPLWGCSSTAAARCSAPTSATSRRRSCTSPPAPARSTPPPGWRAASRPCRSRWRGCCWSRASASGSPRASTRSRRPAPAWSPPPTPSADGSSATCTTARSSGSSRWR